VRTRIRLSTAQRQIEKMLGCTANKGNGLLPREVVGSHLGDGCGDVHQIHEGKLAEQEVYQCMKLDIRADKENGEGVATYCNKEDHHDQDKREKVGEGVIYKPFKDEV
jgi:hypothetical protein